MTFDEAGEMSSFRAVNRANQMSSIGMGAGNAFLCRASRNRDGAQGDRQSMDDGDVVRIGIADLFAATDTRDDETFHRQVRIVFDLVPVMVWSSLPDGTCEHLNKAHSAFTGMTAAESRHLGWQLAIHPDDLAARMDSWRYSLKTGLPSEAEARIRRHDGVYRWFLLRVEPYRSPSGSIVRWYGAATDIEDRKRAEEEHVVSEKTLSLLIDTVPMLIWSSLPDGRADFFNDQWCRFTGLTTDQSADWGWSAALHPDDHANAIRHWTMTTDASEPEDMGFEVRFRRSDGEYRWFWLRANRMRDEGGEIRRWYVTLTDIHDRKLAEESVLRSQTLLSEAQRLAGLGIFSWRVGADLMVWSEPLYRMFQIDTGTPITRAVIESRTFPKERAFMFDAVLPDAELKNVEDEFRVLLPDGAARYLQYRAYLTTTASGEAEYIGTVQDMTDRHLASEALARARLELGQAARTTSLGILTASIAHEVNQPLAGIITNANVCFRMLSSDPPNIAGAMATAQRTLRDGKRAAEVISRLKKLFAEKEINASWCDLRHTAQEIVELVQGDLKRNRIVLVTQYASNLPHIEGDRIQLQQVIINLIRNAIDAINTTTEGPRVIVLEVCRRGESVDLSVRDSGVGYDEQSTADLFKAFYTTKKHGMGIGLSVCQSIVKAHGGRLWAKQNKRRGATFGFSIPLDQRAADRSDFQE